jgi:hypothetical protein
LSIIGQTILFLYNILGVSRVYCVYRFVKQPKTMKSSVQPKPKGAAIKKVAPRQHTDRSLSQQAAGV